jgi:hypothetical protein
MDNATFSEQVRKNESVPIFAQPGLQNGRGLFDGQINTNL